MLVIWWDTVAAQQFRLDSRLLYAVPNGARTAPSVAKRLKAEGLRAGAPDLLLDVARQGYHGLRVEMKARYGKRPLAHQVSYHDMLRAQGYRVEVCYGFDRAKAAIEAYLSQE